MALKTSLRGAVPPFIVMDVMRAAYDREVAGHDICHLEVGQPGTAAPQPVLDAAKAALEQDRIGYTGAFGLPPLRQRLSDHYRDFYGEDVSAERIIVTTGSSGGFVLSFLAIFDPGDRVALASPGYPAYRNILRALNVEPVEVLVGPETNYQPSPEMLDKIDGKLDGLIIASPSNPTGTMLPARQLQALADYCREREIRLISDEIYHGVTYGTEAKSALSFNDQAIVINSFSKYFSMTGWRLGWVVVPEILLRSMECLAQNLFISPPTLSQLAAIAAFDCRPQLDAYVANYGRNRSLLLDQLPRAGFDKLSNPDGAFYLYADVSEMTNDSVDFCRRILAQAGVAITPGIDFDPARGNRYVRFSFAESYAVIEQAARRLINWQR